MYIYVFQIRSDIERNNCKIVNDCRIIDIENCKGKIDSSIETALSSRAAASIRSWPGSRSR